MVSYMDKIIKVSPDKVKPGEKYKGYDYNGGTCYCSITIQEDNTPIVFDKWPISEEKEVLCFFRDMTLDEERQYYIDNTDLSNGTNQLNLMGLHTDLYSVGDAHHEMWNGWIDYEWRHQILNIKNEDFFIAGIAPAPWECFAIDDPIAVVAEYKNTGERFWCHASRESIERMRSRSKEAYEEVMKNGKM